MSSLSHGYVGATQPLAVTILQPVHPQGNQAVTGTVLGEMHDRGQVLHYRVALGGGIVLLAPPSWLHPVYRAVVAAAGLTPPAEVTDELTAQQDFAGAIRVLHEVLISRRRPKGTRLLTSLGMVQP